MLFNSLTFLIFLPIVFLLYWFVCNRSLRLQNFFIVVVSYIFYGWWDWRFLILIAFTSLWSFLVGAIESHRTERSRVLLTVSLIVNLGILAVFKYYNFFISQLGVLLETIGFQAHLPSLQILLPVGISFYTFQALSYTIDVYRRQIVPTKDPIAFFAFISFFPQLVAGPIERATNLLPQFLQPRVFNYASAVEGCRQMLWGFVKKCIVADTCAEAANLILGADAPSSISLWVGVLCFTLQIYGDFSGYSDIAIGCSKLFGIRLMRNFAYPYFARDIAEFWRRWHISLTTWFRDYVYIPLGGSRVSTAKKVRNTFVIFLISGFWHGANWTFIVWGVFHAICFIPLLLMKRNRKYATDVVADGRLLPTLKECFQMASTFVLAMIGWTFFRAPDMTTAYLWLKKMVLVNDLTLSGTGIGNFSGWTLAAILLLFTIEWFNRQREQIAWPTNRWLRILFYYIVIFMIIWWKTSSQEFIYFQF